MSNKLSIHDYFAQPGFGKLFSAIKKKYQSLGRFGGKIILDNLTEEEANNLGYFLGRGTVANPLEAEVAQVEQILQNSRFAIGLAELLPLVLGEALQTKQELVLSQERLWAEFFHSLKPYANTTESKRWLMGLQAGQAMGYRTLLTVYQQDPEQAATILKLCLQVLSRLPEGLGQKIRRPVLAAELTGDPHGLDKDTPLGRLMYFALSEVLQVPDEKYTAQKARAVYRLAGIEEDDLSSNVITVGLRSHQQDQRHNLLASAADTVTPLILPLRFFEQSTNWLVDRVYVLENPAVFSAILDAWDKLNCPSMICTSGQPSVAALQLLDELTDRGCQVFYSGDFDAKGLTIAVSLQQRYKRAFVPWFLDSPTYLASPKGTLLTNEQRRLLGKLEVPWDGKLVGNIRERGYVVYQEVLVEKMLEYVE